jgi:hypothetical protein
MIWLTWRQFRAQAAMLAAALAVLTLVLGVTGPGLAEEYSDGIGACVAQGGDCSDFVQRFFEAHRDAFVAVTAVILVLPALIGLFWGAPLLARELEAGTHRLVWNQSVTRTRWLAVKLGLVGLAAVIAAGLGSLAVEWWADPIDKTAADQFPRIEPLVFAARGIVPMAYAGFAFVLGVTVGMLVRRTVPAMAITLAVFVAAQVAMPLLVRPNLITPVQATFEVTGANVDQFVFSPDGLLVSASPPDTDGAWMISSNLVDASGNTVDAVPPSERLSPTSGPCAPRELEPGERPSGPGAELTPCLAVIAELGYREQAKYHPGSRFWRFQWYETGIYAALAAALAGFCFWRIRKRVA